jgi:hypothetical protein
MEMSCFSSFGANQLIILSSLVSILIADNLSADDLNILASFITSVGDSLALKAAQLSIAEAQDNTKKQILLLEDQLKKLKDSLK